jgi:hypothetical protein
MPLRSAIVGIAITIGFFGLARPIATAIAIPMPIPIPTFLAFCLYFRSSLLCIGGAPRRMKINGLFKAATNNTNGHGLSSQQKFVSFVAAFAVSGRIIFAAEEAEDRWCNDQQNTLCKLFFFSATSAFSFLCVATFLAVSCLPIPGRLHMRLDS